MTQRHNLPLALRHAHLAFWMRTVELLHESCGRWLELADHWLTRDGRQAGAETRAVASATNWPVPASLPMNAGWRLLNHGVGNARDLTMTALNSHAAFDAGMRRALAQWQIDTVQALSASRNAMPFSGALRNLIQDATPAPAEPARKQGRR